MRRTLNFGSRPKYHSGINEVVWIADQLVQMKRHSKTVRYKGGSWLWAGGEFLIRDGEVVWCHRMKNYRDHIEMDVVRSLLGVEERQ